MNNSELYHIGTATSGRYPRGSGKHPHNRGEGLFSRSRRSKKSKKSKGSSQSQSQSQIRKPSESRKRMIIDSGDPMELHKYRKYLTVDEINEGLKRIDTERRLSTMAAEQARRASKGYKVAKAVDKSYNIANYAVKAGKTYNVAASIINAFGDSELPKIDFSVQAKSKKEDKKEDKSNKKG